MNKNKLSSFLFLSIILIFFQISFSVENVCLWYRRGATNTFLNGEYKVKGIYGSQNYYVMNSSNCRPLVYMFYKPNNKEWFIGPYLGNTTSYYARCMKSNISSPSLCNDNWYVPRTLDRDVNVSTGNCPSIKCDSIHVDFLDTTYNYCEGDYTINNNNIYNNIYKKNNNNNVYFYFNHKMFTWICAKQPLITSCTIGVYGRDTQQIWENLSNQQSMLLSWSNNKLVNVTCQSRAYPPSINEQSLINSYCNVGCQQFYDGCNYCQCNGKDSYNCNSINACPLDEYEDSRCCCIKQRDNSISESDYTRLAQACLNAVTIDDCNNRKCVWQC